MPVDFATDVRPFLVDINTVEEYPNNPRIGDINSLVASISANGFYTICLVQDSTGYVVAGNHRRKALQRMGSGLIPVIRQEMSDDDARRIVLADNRTSDLSYYDDPTLFDLLSQMEGDLRGTGYDQASYNLLLQGMEGDEMLGNINQGNTPEDRAIDYSQMDLRNIVLPYSGNTFDEVAQGLISLRSNWAMDTNADVVERLVHEAVVFMEEG